MLGKRLYKTSMLNLFRLILLAIVIFFFNDFYLETFQQEKFQEMFALATTRPGKWMSFINFHLAYPAEFFTFMGLIVIPAIYYGFIRGVSFHEKGIRVNKGLPFFNQVMAYEDIKTYRMLHPKAAISIIGKNDSFVIADNHMERVIAILDQHNIQGDLAGDDFVKIITTVKRIAFAVISFVLLLFVVRKLGLYFFN